MLRPGRGASACAGTTSEESDGNRSQSRNHARLHRMQAAELSDAEVEAELSRPGRVQEVLPPVWPAHAAPGDPLVPTVDGKADASRAPRAARAAGAGPRRGATFASPRALDDERRSRAEPAGRRPAARRRGAAARLGADQLHPGVDRRAQEGRVAEPESE